MGKERYYYPLKIHELFTHDVHNAKVIKITFILCQIQITKQKEHAWFWRWRDEDDGNAVSRSFSLCSLLWSPVLSVSLLAMFSLLVFFAPSIPAFLFVCSISSGILLLSCTCVFVPSFSCLSSHLVPSMFVFVLSFIFQFFLSVSWFSIFIFILPSPTGMLCFWCSSCWRWRPGVKASLLVILEVDFRLRRRTPRVYRLLLLLPVGGWHSTLIWLMRNGIMVAPVVSDRATLVLFLLGNWSNVTMVYGLMQSLVGAPAMGWGEMEQCRLRRGGIGHREKKLRPSVMAQWPIMDLSWR